jgi:hypothetical protein
MTKKTRKMTSRLCWRSLYWSSTLLITYYLLPTNGISSGHTDILVLLKFAHNTRNHILRGSRRWSPTYPPLVLISHPIDTPRTQFPDIFHLHPSRASPLTSLRHSSHASSKPVHPFLRATSSLASLTTPFTTTQLITIRASKSRASPLASLRHS